MKIKEEISAWDIDDWTFVAFVTTISIFAVSLLILGIVCLWQLAYSDGRHDYCYVGNENSTYVVYAHVPWRMDRMIGVALSSEEAHKLMQDTCPVK